ncbi:MAG: hypothetical protein ACRDY7_12795 [Acidimicrobiia bacterium]
MCGQEGRQELGVDMFDEVWEGSYHVAPAASAAHAYLDKVLAVLLDPYARAGGLIGTGPFNLGSADDYRVPDRGYHRDLPRGIWEATAAVDIAQCTVTFWRRSDAANYQPVSSSSLLALPVTELEAAIVWPDPGREQSS